MKKIIALLLVAVMCFALVACGGNKVKNFDELDVSLFSAF